MQECIKKEDWNAYHIVARGFHFIQKINGTVMSEATDEDKAMRRASGILALQLHSGPPMKVQFRNIRLKELNAEETAAAGGHMVLPHLDEVDRMAKKGVGIACLHYGVEVPKGKAGDLFLDWTGGYFETHWSVNPHWVADFKSFPEHPITRGVRPFSLNDEWYFHMRFRPDMEGVTPVLSAHPPKAR